MNAASAPPTRTRVRTAERTVVMTLEQICAIGQIVFMIAAIVVFFIGFRVIVTASKEELNLNEIKQQKKKYMRCFKKCMQLLCAALLLYALMRFCGSYIPMRQGGSDITAIALSSLIEAVYNVGFLLVIPYILMRWHFSPDRKKRLF